MTTQEAKAIEAAREVCRLVEAQEDWGKVSQAIASLDRQLKKLEPARRRADYLRQTGRVSEMRWEARR